MIFIGEHVTWSPELKGEARGESVFGNWMLWKAFEPGKEGTVRLERLSEISVDTHTNISSLYLKGYYMFRLI